MEAPGNCPVCGRIDSVQRVTAIYNESFSVTTRLQSQTTYGPSGRVYITTRRVPATQQTALGQLLAPPRKRIMPLPPGETMLLSLSVLFSVIIFLYGQSGFFMQLDEVIGNTGVAAFQVLLIAFPFLMWLLAHFVIFLDANYERQQWLVQEQERLQHRQRQWEQFCYCRRCNAVYISGFSKGVLPELMEQLYYD